jgi:hypothetical protein
MSEELLQNNNKNQTTYLKIAKNRNRSVSKDEIQMHGEHKGRHTALLIIRRYKSKSQ